MEGKKPKKEYDLIIVGAGPAGLSAGIYAARQKIDALIITKSLGGQLMTAASVENWPGIKHISGAGLIKSMEDHFRQYDLPVESDEAREILKKGKGFIVKTGKKEFYSRAVLITSGRISRRLDVPGESRFLGKGVASCATCDAPMFSGKDVAVAGTGNNAVSAVLDLGKYAKKIYLLSKYDELKGDRIKIEKIKKMKKVEILYSAETKEILGDKFANAIKVRHGGKEKTLKVEGIFVEIGMTPETDMISFVKKNDKGEIAVNCQGEASEKGVFAAGDCTSVAHKQAIIAAGDGAKALLSASRYLEE